MLLSHQGRLHPRPDVQSVVVRIVPTAGSRVPPEDRAGLAEFLPQLFRYRRKKLSNAVERVFGIPRGLFERECAEAGIPPGVRIEELAPEAIVRLWSAMRGPASGTTTPPLEG